MDILKPGRIDDPIDASYAAWPDELENQLGELALASISPLLGPAHLLHVFKQMFSIRGQIDRVLYLLKGFRLKVREQDQRIGTLEGEKHFRAKLESPEFKEALFAAMDEASRTLNQTKIDRYASALARSLVSAEGVDSSIDLSTLIRDISQLTDQDIRILGVLQTIFADVIAHQPNMHDPNSFTEKMGDFRQAISSSALHPDDFQAICERLSGFGLAAEVLRNASRMGLNDFCFRPTRRGLKLLKLLSGI